MAKNIIDWRYWWMKLDPVEDVRVNGGICHNFCGPATIDNFKKELGENAKIKGGETICNIVIEVPANEIPFIYLEDKALVEYEPLYSGKDDRYPPSPPSQTGIFLPKWATKKHSSIHLT